MNKDIIWFLCLGFALGFIARDQSDNQSWVLLFELIQTLGAVTVPILLFIWSQNNEKRKEKDQKQLYEKQECIDLLIPIFPNLSYSERKNLSAEEYRDILLDLYQKLHLCHHSLKFVVLGKYTYLEAYIQECFMFLMPIEFPLKDFNYYNAYYSICITYLKRDMQRYINQGYLDKDWQERFKNHRAYINKYTKDTLDE